MKKSWLTVLAALALTSACGNDESEPSSNGSGGDSGSGGHNGTGNASGGGTAGKTGCSDDPGTGEFPCDVGAILEAKCQRCHTDPSSHASCSAADTCVPAPFPLMTWQETRGQYGGSNVYEHIARAVKSGFMPMKADGLTPPVEALTEEEKTVLIEWAENCAPPADAACD